MLFFDRIPSDHHHSKCVATVLKYDHSRLLIMPNAELYVQYMTHCHRWWWNCTQYYCLPSYNLRRIVKYYGMPRDCWSFCIVIVWLEMGVHVYCGEILVAFIKLMCPYYILHGDCFVSCCMVMRRLYHSECIMWFLFFLSVTPSTKSTNFGSRYLVEGLSEGDEIWQLDRGCLPVCHHWDWWTLAQKVPPGAPKSEGCKKIL